MKTILSLLALFAIAPSSFAGTQYIDCVPTPHDGNDHVIVSLKSASEGTLYLHSGFGDFGENENSGVLGLAVGPSESPDVATFVAENTVATFGFSLPTALVQTRYLDFFDAKLSLGTKDGVSSAQSNLRCFTRLY